MKKLILSFIAVVLVTTAFAEKKPEMMSWDEAYNKASEVLKTLSLDEKIEMTRGHNRFFLPGAPAKGLPHVYTVDASAGVRINNRLTDLSEVRHPQKTTQFPATIALASTFNTELAKAYGEAVGNEARMAGAGVSIVRLSAVVTSSIWVRIHIWRERWWRIMLSVCREQAQWLA